MSLKPLLKKQTQTSRAGGVGPAASITDLSICNTEPFGLHNSLCLAEPVGHGFLSNLSSQWGCYGGFSLWESCYWWFAHLNNFAITRRWISCVPRLVASTEVKVYQGFTSLPVVVSSLWAQSGKLKEVYLKIIFGLERYLYLFVTRIFYCIRLPLF